MSRRQKNDMSSNLRHCPDRPVKNGGGSADLGNRAQCQARTRRPCRGLEIPEGGAWRRFRAPGIFPRTRRRPPAPPPTPPPVSAATALREATHPPPPSSPPPLPPPSLLPPPPDSERRIRISTSIYLRKQALHRRTSSLVPADSPPTAGPR